jgi:hypothetical protein
VASPLVVLNFVGVPGPQEANLGPGFPQAVAMTALTSDALAIASVHRRTSIIPAFTRRHGGGNRPGGRC